MAQPEVQTWCRDGFQRTVHYGAVRAQNLRADPPAQVAVFTASNHPPL